jgi:hypothetical protein
MDPSLIIMIAAFVGVLALLVGLYSAFQGNSDSTVEAAFKEGDYGAASAGWYELRWRACRWPDKAIC